MPLLRQTIWGSDCIPLLPRVASPGMAYINWQGAYCGGRDDVSHETRLADCPGRGDICCGNRRRFAARTQRACTEPLRPAENGAARGRLPSSETTFRNYDRERAINGIKDMAGKIPGIKNVWLKTARNQIKDFSGVYAIEFTSAEAAADYAESPVHEAWSKMWQEQRENSLSFQVSNP